MWAQTHIPALPLDNVTTASFILDVSETSNKTIPHKGACSHQCSNAGSHTPTEPTPSSCGPSLQQGEHHRVNDRGPPGLRAGRATPPWDLMDPFSCSSNLRPATSTLATVKKAREGKMQPRATHGDLPMGSKFLPRLTHRGLRAPFSLQLWGGQGGSLPHW
jgi:hypothetical protein